MNGILYLTSMGSRWMMLPKDFASQDTVDYYFHKWKLKGVFEDLMDTLGEELKQKVKALFGCQFEVVLRPNQFTKRFAVIPKRWIDEGSFAWLEYYGVSLSTTNSIRNPLKPCIKLSSLKSCLKYFLNETKTVSMIFVQSDSDEKKKILTDGIYVM